MGRKKPNWKKIRLEYETTDTSYRKLAEKYNVSPSTLTARAIRENWCQNKEEISIKIDAKMKQKAIEKISDRNVRVLNLWDTILKKVETVVKEELTKVLAPFTGDAIETDLIIESKLESIARTLERAQKNIMISENKLTPDVAAKIALEREKHELEKQRIKETIEKNDDVETGIVLMPPVDEDVDDG